MLRHNTHHHLGQLEESFVYCWLCTHAMFDVTCFPRICRSIGCHFKRYVNTLIMIACGTSYINHGLESHYGPLLIFFHRKLFLFIAMPF